MISRTLDNFRNPINGEPARLRYAPHHRIRTGKAAESAEHIAGSILHGNPPKNGTSDVELFAALHTCAYRATRRPRKDKVSANERLRWAVRWKTIRDHLVERNLGLAYSTLSRFHSDHRDWEDLRSEGLLALTRAVEGFNPWRGFRFSTYACHSIMRSFVHLTNKSTKYRVLFPMGAEAYHEPPMRVDRELELCVDRLFRALNMNLGELTDRESTVIARRFALDGGAGRTLKEIGEDFGLSKERVRQIQNSALDKLRDVLDADLVLR